MPEFFLEKLPGSWVYYEKIVYDIRVEIPRHSYLYCIGHNNSCFEVFFSGYEIVVYKYLPIRESTDYIVWQKVIQKSVERLLIDALKKHIQYLICKLLIEKCKCGIPYEWHFF
jgi:hypothetical protein